ncbi:MAG: 16S rRNA (cytidine(1402)-2'-O)-methyltransferase [Candidatus Nealsonbacteria bacterium]|nr:16S rRNA (cytidine(1402)-2'-O)-methyltransferase [Candidatus Nealsonbacteria bacterium]
MVMPTLYIVGTPIGNLEDISSRARQTLAGVDFILAEDTRVTKRLLERYQIQKPLISYHQHSQLQKVDDIVGLLKEGKNLALVSDAGTPGIADPGNELIEKAIEALGDRLNIVPIPGCSALAAAASIAGFPMDKFLFLGFPPIKKKRKKFFEEALNSKYPVILYESTHRILKTLSEMAAMRPEARVVVCHELTKKFEKTYRGRLDKVLEQLKGADLRGEFVVIVSTR